ncbi:GNAT family N-acetyltransferase [Vibrio ordalii]|uniref:GNAT family N-acetyltransferase n=1 Tax=Vibrio ordalii TaxID=28174 RepID=UPI002578CA07|nr:GNAT family N-acetyltransferase [Vibrio ordalii]
MRELISKTIKMRLIREEDAEFILSLRLDERYNKFLSSVDDNLAAQKEWIRKYKQDEEAGLQYYFIIETKDSKPCGTVRLYDLKADSFCWGSWVLNEDKTKYSALESAFLIYQFGFEELGFKKSHFDVRKGNLKVIDFHKKFGAVETGEDEDNYYYEISQESVQRIKNKFSKIIG